MILFLLLVVAFVLYGSCLHGEMLFDDFDSTLRNKKIDAGDYRAIWREPFRGHWRHFTRISFAWNVRLFGPQTFSFHVTNIALHAVNGVILSLVARAMGAGGLATPCALLFVCHSLARDSVAYISSRSVLLSSLFSLAAIWVALIGLWPLALPLLLLAFYSKEDTGVVALTIGAILAIRAEWSQAAVFLVLPVAAAFFLRRNIRDLIGHSEQLSATQAASAITDVGYPPIPSRWVCFKTSFTETMLRFPAWVVGIGHNFDHDTQEPSTIEFCMAFAALACFALLYYVADTHVRIAMAIVWISPMALYWFAPVRDSIAEYRCYLPLAGACAVAGLLLPTWAMVPLILWLGYRTFTRTFDYADPVSFWAGCVRDGSDHKVRVLANLAAMYQSAGRDAEALAWNNRVLAVDPTNGPSLVNRGLLEARAGNLPGAQDVLVDVTTRYPRYLLAWQVLAALYQATKDEPRQRACLAQISLLGG